MIQNIMNLVTEFCNYIYLICAVNFFGRCNLILVQIKFIDLIKNKKKDIWKIKQNRSVIVLSLAL